jgi:Polyketide cyclase / dehydrase and lipid transport
VTAPPSTPALRGSAVVIEGGADIARSPEDVFDYCSDHTREPEWNVKMKHVRKLTDGPMGLGTRYEMEFVPGRPMVVDCVRFERPTEWQMSGETMGMKVGWGGQVVATKTGSHLVLRMQLQPHGLMRLISPLLRRRMQPDVEHDIGAIKVLLER